MGRMLLLRDLLWLVVTLALWRVVSQWSPDSNAADIVLSLVVAGLTAFCGFLVHEWGHWIGARVRGSVTQWPDRITSLFLFRFDCVRNSRSQFLWMSCGGFIASALAVAFLVYALPFDRLAGQAALTLTVLGVVATFVLEVPTAWKNYRGAPLPQGFVYFNQ